MRSDGRLPEQLRPTRITPNYLIHAEGSVLVEAGKTKVICTASVEDRVPPFRRNTGKGWVTAEYGMLPRATTTRSQRESTAGKVGGRTQEIQRLIGRSLRAVTRMEELGERTITLDCDVIQADGGRRTASITGAFVALVLALLLHREHQRHERSGDRRCACAAIGLNDVAVEGNRAFADLFKLGDGAERATDQTLNLLRTSADLAGRRLTLGPRGRRARKHAVFGGDPTLARVPTKGWHAIFHTGCADDFRFPGLDEDRAFGVNQIVRSNASRAELFRKSAVRSHINRPLYS